MSATPNTNFEKIHYYFKDYESPEHFITIDYLFCIACCLGRRVMFQKGEPIFPNIFPIIVGPPAVGKSLPARRMTNELKSLMNAVDGKPKPLINVAASRITVERLYQVLETYSEVIKDHEGKPQITASGCFILADELGLLFSQKDRISDLVNFLIGGYDCTDKLDYDTKQQGTNIIINPCVNLFGCCTPTWVSENLPPRILDLGIGSRMLFVWGDKIRHRTTFLEFSAQQTQALAEVKEHFRALTKVTGLVRLMPDAHEWYDNWVQREQDKYKINSDPKLEYYYSRKRVHLVKLAMLFHFSENMDLVLTIEDFNRALAFLGFLEKDMHKALAGVNNNPEATLAENMLRAFEIKKGMRKIEIVQQFFGSYAMESIDNALGWLNVTNQAWLNPMTQKWEVKKTNLEEHP